MFRKALLLTVPVAAFGIAVGCANAGNDAGGAGHSDAHHAADKAHAMKATANITPAKATTTQPANGQPTGTVTFTEDGGKVKVVADIKGLKPNSKHGFHIHEKGDISAPDLSSAGGHYNPGKHQHGAPATGPAVHAGDLGNIEADDKGNAHYEITVENISINGENAPIVGRAVIIHAKPDDLKSQPTGDAGGRIGGGVIEINK
jgi:Cu-Zn family superoxide dismutase